MFLQCTSVLMLNPKSVNKYILSYHDTFTGYLRSYNKSKIISIPFMSLISLNHNKSALRCNISSIN